MQQHERLRGVWFWFSLGHFTVMVLARLGFAAVTVAMRSRLASPTAGGKIIGTGVSAALYRWKGVDRLVCVRIRHRGGAGIASSKFPHGGQPRPVEPHAVSRLFRRQRLALGDDHRLLYVAIQPESVHLQIRPVGQRGQQVLRATEEGDLGPFDALLATVSAPFVEEQRFMSPRREEERVLRTFCGT